MAQKAHSLSHTKRHCKYHFVFTTKYKRKIIYNQYLSSLSHSNHKKFKRMAIFVNKAFLVCYNVVIRY